MKIGIMLPNWIGDVVMATPTLRAIRKYVGPAAEIRGIMRPYVANVLEGTPWLDDTIFYDRKSSDARLRTLAVTRQLRRWRPDTMVLLTNSLRAGVVAWGSGAAMRVGYDRYCRGPLLTHKRYPPRVGKKLQPIPAIDYYLRLAYALGCPTEPPRMELATTPQDEAGADDVWHNLGLDRARRVIVFNTGSAQSGARHWPTEYYIDLARRVAADDANVVLVICGPGERDAAAEIERIANHPRVKSMAEQDLSLGVAKACVRRSQLMVTTDSGPRHFAPAFDVPVITLCGPIDPRWSESHHRFSINLQHPVDCGPCGERICPLKHHRCMRELSVDRVFGVVQRQLGGLPGTNAA